MILASGSPRRKFLLEELGFRFDVYSADVEELHDVNMPLRELCEYNAMLKAKAVAMQFPETCILAADTLVYKDMVPLGKPSSAEEAEQTLMELSGSKHSVCTGLCLVSGDKVKPFSEVTEVNFKCYDRSVVKEYMACLLYTSPSPRDS